MLKRIILGSMVVGASLFASSTNTNQLETNNKMTQKQIKEMQSKIGLFNRKNIVIKDGYKKGNTNIYQVETEIQTPNGPSKIPIFLVKSGKEYVLFLGQAYTSEGKPLKIPLDKKTIDAGIAFTIGSGEKGEIYVLTDPECPFCKKLERTKGDAFKNYKTHVIIFPLSFHAHAKPMTQWILRGKTDMEKAKRFKDIVKGSEQWKKDLGFDKGDYRQLYRDYLTILQAKDLNSLNDKQKAEFKKFFKSEKEWKQFKAYLEKSSKAFKAAGARGTPTILDKDFNQVDPYRL